jgi:hypothetical protein
MSDKNTSPRVTPKTLVYDLIEAYPFLIEELGKFNPHYRALQDPMMREMMARKATLEMAAMNGGVKLDELMNFIADTIQRHAGLMMITDSSVSRSLDPERLEAFRRIMVTLHEGGDIEIAQKEFAELVRHTSPGEVAEMEQHLIQEGMPVSEIKRMCDVHLQVVNPSLKKVTLEVPSGHPIDSFLAENRLIEEAVKHIRGILEKTNNAPDPKAHPEEWKELDTYTEKLREIDKHYLRKEHQLFSHLERKGFTGPSQVMWAVHDDIRAQLKLVREACAQSDAAGVAQHLPALLTAVGGMVQKEEAILFPTALQLLEESAWIEIKRGETEIGYMESFSPGLEWKHATVGNELINPEEPISEGLLQMNVGQLTLEQVNLMLTHMPIEVSFVDENDEVRYYSNQPHKIFPRTPDAIGRKVQNCHPPKSVHLVNQIIAEFKSGKRDVAEFWIEMNEMFIHIRYFAMRDADGTYRGSLEVVQNVAGIRKLEGERRLLAEDA